MEGTGPAIWKSKPNLIRMSLSNLTSFSLVISYYSSSSKLSIILKKLGYIDSSSFAPSKIQEVAKHETLLLFK